MYPLPIVSSAPSPLHQEVIYIFWIIFNLIFYIFDWLLCVFYIRLSLKGRAVFTYSFICFISSPFCLRDKSLLINVALHHLLSMLYFIPYIYYWLMGCLINWENFKLFAVTNNPFRIIFIDVPLWECEKVSLKNMTKNSISW